MYPYIYSYSWNHKFLDYEIETWVLDPGVPAGIIVGIISFSITRLKPVNLTTNTCRIQSWNHKFLDYEIETLMQVCQVM